jgi:protein-L-isoaspartate O-methyltransferase
MIEQLNIGGRLISPVMDEGIQNLVLIEKGDSTKYFGARSCVRTFLFLTTPSLFRKQMRQWRKLSG